MTPRAEANRTHNIHQGWVKAMSAQLDQIYISPTATPEAKAAALQASKSVLCLGLHLKKRIQP